jgi:hypothetical protein
VVCHIPSSYGVEDGGEAMLVVLDVVNDVNIANNVDVVDVDVVDVDVVDVDVADADVVDVDVDDVDVVAAFAVAEELGPFAAKPTCILPASKTTNCDLMNISPRIEKPIPASL